jgi:hypothetical protein
LERGTDTKSDICAKCGRQAMGKVYPFYYGTEGGKVLGHEEAFICDRCVSLTKWRDAVVCALLILVPTSIGVSLYFLLPRLRWLPLAFCLAPTAVFAIVLVVYMLRSPTGEFTAISARKAALTQQHQATKFWDQAEGRKLAERMQQAQVGVCAKCGKEGVGEQYPFYYGWETDRQYETSKADLILTKATLNTTITTYRIGGQGSAFICDRCTSAKPGKRKDNGESLAIEVATEGYKRQYGNQTQLWKPDAYYKMIRENKR